MSEQSTDDTDRLECNSCEWFTTGASDRERVASAIYHAIGAGHVVSEDDLVEQYDRLESTEIDQ